MSKNYINVEIPNCDLKRNTIVKVNNLSFEYESEEGSIAKKAIDHKIIQLHVDNITAIYLCQHI